MSQTPSNAEPPVAALEVPQAVAPVAPEQAAAMVKVDDKAVPALERQVDEFIAQVLQLDVHSAAFKEKVDAIHGLGNADIRAAAGVSNRMLDRPVRELQGGPFAETSDISKALLDLRHTIEDLEPPSGQDLFQPRKLLGLIPFGNRVRDYFDKYQSAQSHLNGILNSLYRGKDGLMMDNATIETEKGKLWETMQRLAQYVHVGKAIDRRLEAQLAQVEQSDREKARVIREEMLFYVRQKVMDLLTQLAVAEQGYLALDLIRRNNLELIKGVDRATSTTVSALRTAVMVAQGLIGQKLVLDQVTALNTTTGNLIEQTSKMLKDQSTEIHKQAVSATLDIDQLRRAFDNTFASMDALADFRTKALDSMGRTVEALTKEVERAQTYLDRVRAQDAREVTADLHLPSTPEGVVKL